MIITPETEEDIVAILASEFRTFGGGVGSSSNPIAAALKDTPAQFAAGVDVLDVVRRVRELDQSIKEQRRLS